MYIGVLVVTLATCSYLFQLDWSGQSCATAVCVWSCFNTSLGLRCRKISSNNNNVEDDPRSGRPISSTNDQNVEVVWAVMVEDRRLSVRMIAEETGLDKSAVHRIICTCEKFVQNWCRKTCLWSKKRTGWKFVRICWEDSKLSQIFWTK